MSTVFNKQTSDGFTEASLRIPQGSLLATYLNQFNAIDFSTWEPAQYTVVKDFETTTPAFLTVVTRTIGTRLEELEEVFLCLQAQRDQDFEVCLVGHNIDEDRIARLSKLIDAQPEQLRNRIRFITITGEGRARPLNAGFAATRSDYAVILDDDDLVFDHWTEAFHMAAIEHPGSIIHCKVFDQLWEAYTMPDGTRRLAATDTPGTIWALDFDMAEQLAENHCPIMGLAFPLYPFRDMGVVFDETLSTTEDWDFLMRTALVCGVHNADAETSLYRLWQNADRSMTQHGVQEWTDNYIHILDKRASNPMLVSGDVLEPLLHTTNIERDSGIYLDLDSSRATIFDAQDAMLDTDMPPAKAQWLFPGFFTFPIPRNTIVYDCLDEYPDAVALGIWFGHCRTTTFRDITITCEDKNGNTWTKAVSEVETNGMQIAEDAIAFLKAGPWIKIPCISSQGEKACKVTLTFHFDRFVDDEVLEGTRIWLKAKNWLARRRRK